MDERVEAMIREIDAEIRPEKMTQQEAIEFCDRIADYCASMADGIRGDLEA